MNNDQRIIEKLTRLEREIERLKRVEVPIMPEPPTGLYRKMPRGIVFNNTSLANNYDTDYAASTYGVPAGASAIYVLMLVQSATVGAHLILSEGGTHGDSVSQLVNVASKGNKVTGIVPLSADGKFNAWVPSGALNAWVYILGYFT